MIETHVLGQGLEHRRKHFSEVQAFVQIGAQTIEQLELPHLARIVGSDAVEERRSGGTLIHHGAR